MRLSLIGEKGGTGKSTLALSIATELMARNERVLLVDSDPQGTSRLACLQAREAGVLAPDCIVGTKQLERELQKFSSYQHIIIDTPGRLGEMQQVALACSDIALVPVAPTAPDVWAMKSIATKVRAALVPAKMMVRTCMAAEAQELLKELGLPVFKAGTHIRAAWAETMMRGGVAQSAPGTPAAEELKAVVAELTRFARRAS
jgi:chromosome partitioning protein